MRPPVRRYSLFSILREARRFGTGWEPAWRKAEPAERYDVAILGGGAAALALAYEIVRGDRTRRVGVLAGGPLGGAPGAANTALRTDRREPAAIALHAAARQRYDRLSRELDYNLGVTPRGLLSLAFSEVELDRLAYVAASGAAAGVPLWMVPPREARALLPDLAPDTALPQPLCSALWQPGAALVDGDAVVWGFARMAAALGADIVEDCAATELVVEGGRVRGVRLSGKVVEAGTVVVAAAEAVPLLDAAGIALPLAVRQRHVFTLAAGPPFLDVTVEASLLGGVASRSRRGGTILTRRAAAGVAPWRAAGEAAGRLVALLPAAGRRGLASAAAVTTATTPDGAPILGPLGPDGLWAAIGWDDQEVAAAPAAGAALAAAIEEGDPGPELAPFAAARFASGALLDERPALEPA